MRCTMNRKRSSARKQFYRSRVACFQLSIGRIKTKINYEHDRRLFRAAIVEDEEQYLSLSILFAPSSMTTFLAVHEGYYFSVL